MPARWTKAAVAKAMVVEEVRRATVHEVVSASSPTMGGAVSITIASTWPRSAKT